MSSPISRWETLRNHLKKLEAARKGANPVTLIAVSKGHPAEVVIPLLEAGHRDFGENRVQEAAAKWPDLKRRFPQARLHLIGGLQTNKAKEALALFDTIHTVDREGLVDALMKASRESRVAKEFFIQVNTGEEPQKGGVTPRQLPDLLNHMNATRDSRLALPLAGLMCIPPAGESPAPHFALLARMARDAGLSQLSMGMSGDYETAIRLGATHVRVGTGIFGERNHE